jgi:class 3 adenylate cyclase
VALKEDLQKDVAAVFRAAWEDRDGTVVPADESLTLGNDAVKLDATVLYADLADSTKLVDNHAADFAAEIYKTFLHCAAKVIRNQGGKITAYDGDRIMAVFIGDVKNSNAVRAALKIHHAVLHIISPAQKVQYPHISYGLKHVVGIDTSPLFVARTGVRGANDLVWVGRAANYAAKLATLPDSHASYITAEVYNKMNGNVKTWTDGRNMWEAVRWDNFDNRTIYRSNWWWDVDFCR